MKKKAHAQNAKTGNRFSCTIFGNIPMKKLSLLKLLDMSRGLQNLLSHYAPYCKFLEYQRRYRDVGLPVVFSPPPLSRPWAHACFLIVKRCILRQWIQPQAPSMELLLNNLNKLFHIEKLDIELNTKLSRTLFTRKWNNYVRNTFDPKFPESILNPDYYHWT